MTSLLIVDDNRQIRQLIKNIVRKISDEVFECSDGTEALPAYLEHHPDWVLMDVEMGKMDGIEATKAILREFPAARIIIVTNHTDAQTRAAARAAGAQGFLSKDNLMDLRSMIEKAPAGIEE